MVVNLQDTYAEEHLMYLAYQIHSIIVGYNTGLVYGLFSNNNLYFIRLKQGINVIFHYDISIPDYLFFEFKKYMRVSTIPNGIWYNDEEMADFVESIQRKCFIDEIIMELK